MSDNENKSSDDKKNPSSQNSISDLIKLLISLASGVIAISAAFTEKLSNGVGFFIIILVLSWAMLALSIFFGVTALSILISAQQNDSEKWYEHTLDPMRKCWYSFQIGVVMLIVYASIISGLHAWSINQEDNQQVILKIDTCSHNRLMIIDTSNQGMKKKSNK